MKNATKKVLAILMTLLMAVAMLPITASAIDCAEIILELKEPYYGENLSEILPEIKIEQAFDFLEDGQHFIIYYNAEAEEDADDIINKLLANPLVKNAYSVYKIPEEPMTNVMFRVKLPTSYDGEGYYVELGKLLSGVTPSKVEALSRWTYDIYFDVESFSEIELIYNTLRANPFFSFIYPYVTNPDRYVTVGGLKTTTNKTYTVDEVKELLPEVEISEVRELYGGLNFYVILKDKTLSATLNAAEKLNDNPNVVKVECTDTDDGYAAVLPKVLEKNIYIAPEKTEVTVETALAALRITAGLSEVKNGVYDYRLADAIWQYDCDGDKVITVSDALSLLRIAAGIKA